MVRILRIISQISVVVTGVIAILVMVFGFGPPLEIQKLLSQTSIVERLKKNCGDSTKKDDKESPLVVQARLFALRIDPPIPTIKTTPRPPKNDSGSSITADPPVLPIVPAEVKLIATANYKDHPEKSLALLNLVSGGCKWVRQGEEVDQSIVGEIKDGKIIICKGGTMYKDLHIPARQDASKNLLKNQ